MTTRPFELPVTKKSGTPDWLRTMNREVRPAFAEQREESISSDRDTTEIYDPEADFNHRVEECIRVRLEEVEGAAREKGEMEGRREFETARQLLGQILGDLSTGYENLLQQAEQQLIDLTLLICQEILHKSINEDRDYISRLTREALSLLPATEEVEVRVSESDLKLLQPIIDELGRELPRIKRINLKADSAVVAGCVVETRVARIDGTLETRLRNIGQALQAGVKH